MFWGQIAGTIVAGTVQLGVQAWMFTNIEDMCDPHQKDGFICPGTEVFGTASIIVSDITERSIAISNAFRIHSGAQSGQHCNSRKAKSTSKWT